MNLDSKLGEISPVCPEQIGIALALFRAAVLTKIDGRSSFAGEAVFPLTDPAMFRALLGEDVLQRAMAVINIHFECNDGIHPVVQRVVCFLELLKEQSHNPHPLWTELVTFHNRFLAIVNAIALCPARGSEAFEIDLFATIARQITDIPRLVS